MLYKFYGMNILKGIIIMVALTQTVFSQNIKKDNTAILLIEFQKTWTEKGIFRKIIKKEYEQRNVLNNTKNLISEARKEGITVIQAPLILDKTDENYKKTPFPARLLKRFTKGTWKAEFTDGIYEKSDILVKGRCGFDACEGSNLEQLLEQNNINPHCSKNSQKSNKSVDNTISYQQSIYYQILIHIISIHYEFASCQISNVVVPECLSDSKL